MRSDPRSLLAAHGLRPKKSFGQNFLLNREILDDIAQIAIPDPNAATTVLEFGAGTGALTEVLLERKASVIAVERDRDLLPLLASTFAAAIDNGSLRLVEDDAATFPIADTFASCTGARVLAGNLPYQITGRLIERAVHTAASLDRAVFLVQKEVGERLAAAPDSDDYGALSVFTQAAFAVRVRRIVGPGDFHPPPAVVSAVVELIPHATPRAIETERFRAVVKAAFAQRRKTLRNAWRALGTGDTVAVAAEKSGISLDVRGETLAVEDFARMAAALDG